MRNDFWSYLVDRGRLVVHGLVVGEVVLEPVLAVLQLRLGQRGVHGRARPRQQPVDREGVGGRVRGVGGRPQREQTLETKCLNSQHILQCESALLSSTRRKP